MFKKKFGFYGKQAIIFSDGNIINHAYEVAETELFKDVISGYINRLRLKDSPLLGIFPDTIKKEEQDIKIIYLMQKLARCKKDEILETEPGCKDFFKDICLLNQFVEGFYDYWREFERFFVCY